MLSPFVLAVPTRKSLADSRVGLPEGVSGAELAELAVVLARAERAVQAASVAAVAQFARREEVGDPQDVAGVVERVHAVGVVEEFASTEVAAVLGVSTRTADARLEQASQLSARLPRLLGKVADGLVELGQVGRVLHESAEVDTLELVHTIDADVTARVGSCDPTRLGALARYAMPAPAPSSCGPGPPRTRRTAPWRCVPARWGWARCTP